MENVKKHEMEFVNAQSVELEKEKNAWNQEWNSTRFSQTALRKMWWNWEKLWGETNKKRSHDKKELHGRLQNMAYDLNGGKLGKHKSKEVKLNLHAG